MASYNGSELITAIPQTFYEELERIYSPDATSLNTIARILVDNPFVTETHTKSLVNTLRYISSNKPFMTIGTFVDKLREYGGYDMSRHFNLPQKIDVFLDDIPMRAWERWSAQYPISASTLREIVEVIIDKHLTSVIFTLSDLQYHLLLYVSRKVSIKEFTIALEETKDRQALLLKEEIEKYLDKNRVIASSVTKIIDECAVCLDKPREKNYVFSCGHQSCCKECADEIIKSTSKCPICRQVCTYIRIYN